MHLLVRAGLGGGPRSKHSARKGATPTHDSQQCKQRHAAHPDHRDGCLRKLGQIAHASRCLHTSVGGVTTHLWDVNIDVVAVHGHVEALLRSLCTRRARERSLGQCTQAQLPQSVSPLPDAAHSIAHTGDVIKLRGHSIPNVALAVRKIVLGARRGEL